MKALAAFAAILTLPATAGAVTQQQAISAVQAKAASLPAATSRAQARANQAALQPLVNQAVATGAASALANGLGHLDPNVAADLATAVPPRVVSTNATPAGVARARAHTAGCWGHVAQTTTFYEAGAAVAWVYDRINGWCGNGSRITWYGGPTYASWTWGIWCLGDNDQDFSWDAYPSWLHSGRWGEAGVSYAFGCFAYLARLRAINRVAANGYHDNYNDYGF